MKLFSKLGRRMVLRPEGERLLDTARKLLALNDQIVETLAHQSLSGEISLGAIQDFADSILPTVLAQFRQSHPDVRISARVDSSKKLIEAVEKGKLDLALCARELSGSFRQVVRTDRMQWLGCADYPLSENDTVPLVVFEQPCMFRDAAISALNEAGREWEVVFTSPSLSGLRAAAAAGLGVTVRTINSFHDQLSPVDPLARLPALPQVDFALYTKPELSDAALRLCEIFTEQLRG